MADTLESLEIEVKHNASDASSEIAGITKEIEAMGKALAGVLPQLKEYASVLAKVGGSLKKTLPKAGGATGTPLPDDLRAKIANANKLEIAVHKGAKAMENMDDAFAKGNEDAAWKEREKAVNAVAQAVREQGKAQKEAEKAAAQAQREAVRVAKEKEKAQREAARAAAKELKEQQKAEKEAAKAAAQAQKEIAKAIRERDKAREKAAKEAAKPQAHPLDIGMRDTIASAGKVEVLQNKLQSLRTAMQEAFQAGDVNKAYSLQGQILSTQEALDKLTQSAKPAKRSFLDFAKAILKTRGPLSNFISSLKRIAMYRILRTIIKEITSAFSEGLKNAYAYSQGIVTEGHRFSQALDSMSSAGLKMKNQLGSALISLLSAMAPVINQMIALVVRLADAFSQVFAAFTGTTYLKAKDVFQQWEDVTEDGAKAAKEWKNQLLGFDEINRLEAPGDTGSGKNPTTPAISEMFEDTKLSDWAMKVREFILWCEEHLDLVKGIALAIGAAFLAWKIASIIAPLAAVEGGLLAIFAGIALVVGGFVLLAKGMIDWIKTGELTKTALIEIEVGLIAIGAGIALLTGSWIPLLVAAAVAAAILVITQWDKLIAKAKEWRDKFKEYVGDGKLDWQDFAFFFTNKVYGMMTTINNIISGIQRLISWVQQAIEWLRNLGSISGNNGGGTFLAGYVPGQYASGGYPDDGQIFIARETGPEMVGTIGGRTAVANNADIVSAIEGGVYRAMTSAGMGSGNGKGESIAIFNMNGREFMRAIWNDRNAVISEHGVSLVANG